MDFWRTYRLVYAQRWLIAAMTLIAAMVIFLGTTLAARTSRFQAEAALQPQDSGSLSQEIERTSSGSGAGGANGSSSPAADTMANVSDLIMILRSSNDLYGKTAALLREEEGLRSLDVQRILERNGYFAPTDSDIEGQARELTAKKELTAAQATAWIGTHKKAARERTGGQLAQGRDASGAFAAAGLGLSDAEIMNRIRDNIAFDTVSGPLSTESTPQIVNQIRVTGKFEREAEANLYVNLLCVAFIDFYTNQKSSATNARVGLLEERLTQAHDRLAKAREAEVNFRRQTGVSLTTAAGATLSQVATLEKSRNDAEADFRAAAASVAALAQAAQTARASRTVTLPTEENPAVQRARDRVAAAQIAFQKVDSTNLGVQSDEYLSAKAELTAAQRELTAAQSRTYSTTIVSQSPEEYQARLSAARVSRDAAQQRLAVLTNQLAAQRATLANLPAAQARLADLDREVTISENNVRDLEVALAKQQTYNIEHGRAGTITLVSQAHAVPLSGGLASQRGKLLTYGVVLSLLFGIGLVVGLDALDNSVRTREDVEKLTGLPVAGMIPAHLDDWKRAARVTLLEPLSPAAEAYRLLRTDLIFTAQEKPFQSLVLATGKPGQGATTTLCNLAIVLSQTGRRVILVDADLRSPKLHQIFGTQNTTGLSTVLSGTRPLDDALTPTGIENLTLLPSGYIPMNPSELLSSLKMQALHTQLKERADFVLFDTPSAIAFSDSAVLASLADTTLMVVRSANIPRGSEDQVRTLLHKAHANLIGVVLNGIPAEQVDSVHYHHHYYPVLPAPPPDRSELGSGSSGDSNDSSGTAGLVTIEMPAASFAPAQEQAPVFGNTPRVVSPPRPKGIGVKAIALMIIAGILLGGLVLWLGSGTTVH